MRIMFKDSELQKEFETEGFVQVPLLSKAQCEELLLFYQSLESGNEQAFFTSIWSGDQQHRELVDQKLKATILPEVSQYLQDCKPVFSNFMVKRPVENSHIGLHQDWTFTDEVSFPGVNCWCPLVDTHTQNGALRIVKRSHTFPNFIRGRNIRSPYDPIQDFIRNEYMSELQVPAGMGVIFDERLLHDSQDNKSGFDRVAVSLVLIPEETEVVHFIRRESSPEKIDQLKIGPDFFTKNGLFDPLDHIPNLAQTEYHFKGLNESEFSELYQKCNS